MELNGKVAFITGGTMGIGAAIAVDLARQGADIAIVARNLGDPAENVKSQIESRGRRCHLMIGDMTKREDCVTAVERNRGGAGTIACPCAQRRRAVGGAHR